MDVVVVGGGIAGLAAAWSVCHRAPAAAVTVLEAGPCRVLGLRTQEKDGYAAVRIAFEPAAEKRLTQPILGAFKKAGVDPHRHQVEIRGYDGLEQGRSSRRRSSPPASSST